MQHEMRFPNDNVIPDKQKTLLLGVLREEEKKLLEIYRFVTYREKAMGPMPTYTQLELFK